MDATSLNEEPGNRGKPGSHWNPLVYTLRVFAWLWKSLRFYGSDLFERFKSEDVFIWTGAIAFKVLISFIPLAILGTGVLGLIWQTLDVTQADTFDEVAYFFQTFLPQYRSEALIAGIEDIARRAGTYTIIGLGALFVLSMSLFSTLHVVIARVFKEVHRERSIARQYLFDIRMVLQVGLLFLLSVTLTIMLSTEGFLGFFDGTRSWLIIFWRYLTTGLSSYLLPFAITSAMFFQLYYFIPRPHPTVRSAAVGALFTSILWEVAKNVFTFYATSLKPFDRYVDPGERVGFSPDVGDVLGIILVLVFWAYYSGVIFIVGAMIAARFDQRRVLRDSANELIEG